MGIPRVEVLLFVDKVDVGGGSRGIFNQRTPSIWNENDPTLSLADATGGSSQASEKATRLAQMYRRPFEIMNDVTLAEVLPWRTS